MGETAPIADPVSANLNPDVQIIAGPAAVWVNGPDGSCLGRFGVMGIDVHRTATEQMAGASPCLDCTHGRTTLADWIRFKESMARHHAVDLGDVDTPRWLV